MPPLILMIVALAWNVIRSLRGESTICSTTRSRISASAFCIGFVAFVLWFPRHWLGPKLAARR